MNKLLKKLFLVESVILISIFCWNAQCLAQPEQDSTTVTTTDQNNGQQETVEVKEKPQEGAAEIQQRVKHGLAFEILGRGLTQKEKSNYGDNITREDLKNILVREQGLTIVRALITVGEKDSVKDVLNVYQISKTQTYNELVDYFGGLVEKYGSVKAGFESEYIYNIKDDEQAFKKAAFKAYETVFGISEDKQNKDQILDFLTQNNAITYSKMIQVLMQTMTPEVKRQILFKALDQVGRGDLKINDKFVNKILEQEFTYEHLMELFKELKRPTPPAQPVNPQKQ